MDGSIHSTLPIVAGVISNAGITITSCIVLILSNHGIFDP